MQGPNRRTFLKCSVALAAASVADRVFSRSPIAGLNLSPGSADLPFFTGVKIPEVIAHRGGNGQWPGETLHALKEATKPNVDADALEMDVYLTQDGRLALMHDVLIQKTTDGRGFIHRKTLSELQQLSAAYHWPEKGESDFKGKSLNELPENLRNDLRVPSLEEVFELFPTRRMVIEMKPAFRPPADELYRLIREHNMSDRVLVASFSGNYMNRFRELCARDKTRVATSLALSKSDLTGLAADAVEAPFQIINKEFVKKMRAKNLRVHAWTVNQITDMKNMISLSVDGIITDYPGPLLALLGRIKTA